MNERLKPVEILLVEDDPGDVLLTREAIKESKLNINLRVVNDGAEALDFLHQQGKYTNALRPHLILLDLNLPNKDGREVLSEIKTDNGLKQIPVVVLTASRAETDIAKCYKLHANAYSIKPLNLDDFLSVVSRTADYWLNTVTLPPGE